MTECVTGRGCVTLHYSDALWAPESGIKLNVLLRHGSFVLTQSDGVWRPLSVREPQYLIIFELWTRHSANGWNRNPGQVLSSQWVIKASQPQLTSINNPSTDLLFRIFGWKAGKITTVKGFKGFEYIWKNDDYYGQNKINGSHPQNLIWNVLFVRNQKYRPGCS